MLRSVKRDQFGVSPHGIVHKSTDAAFTPDPGDSSSGSCASANFIIANGAGFIRMMYVD
jgi:hypothetical protein